MKQWHITVGDTIRTPNIISESGKQDTPKILCEQDGIPFSVEFYNRSDYFAARDSNVDVRCVVVSRNRSKSVVGIARNLHISNVTV